MTLGAVIIAEQSVLFHLFSIAIRVMRVLIAVCACPPLKFHLSEQSKPMNFVHDGVHRMFQLTQHCPPELKSNSRRMKSILQARIWDT